MRLTVMERLLLLNALPTTGNLTTVKIIRELRESLSFSEGEHKSLNFRDAENGNIQWDGGVDKVIEIEGKALEIARKALTQLEEQEKLNVGHISLYEKILGDK